MSAFTVYSLATGNILRTGSVRDDWVEFQAQEGEGVLPLPSDYLTQYVDIVTKEIKNKEDALNVE